MKVYSAEFPIAYVYLNTDRGRYKVTPLAGDGYHKVLKEDADTGEFLYSGVDKLDDEEFDFLVETAKNTLEGKLQKR